MEDNFSAPGKFLDPEVIIGQLGIGAGSVVVDFGCGPGYFTLPLAKVVGEDGKVFALDVLPQSLETVASEAQLAGLSNIETKRVNLENTNGSKLEPSIADWVIMKDVLFQNKKKEAILAEALRILKNGGRILVIEWGQTDLSVGPGKEMRILPEDLKTMAGAQNFKVEKDIEAGHFHYAFVAVK